MARGSNILFPPLDNSGEVYACLLLDSCTPLIFDDAMEFFSRVVYKRRIAYQGYKTESSVNESRPPKCQLYSITFGHSCPIYILHQTLLCARTPTSEIPS